MKTKLIIEIESPDSLGVYPEVDFTGNSFEEMPEEEKKEYDKKFCKDLHKDVIEYFKKTKEQFQTDFEDGMILEDYAIESWDDITDYKIKIDIEEE